MNLLIVKNNNYKTKLLFNDLFMNELLINKLNKIM